MPQRLGAHAPQLDEARALQTKKGRREQGRFLVEGPTLVGEALAAGHRPLAVYVAESALASLPSEPALEHVSFLVPERAIGRLSNLETSPGIVAVFDIPARSLEEALAGAPVVVLAGVADPGNAGTLLRTAEIFGFRGAVFTADAVEPFNPKVIRATMGAIFRVRLAVADAPAILAAAERFGYTTIAASSAGEPLRDAVFPQRSLIAIGNERRGVAASLPGVSRSVAIPQYGAGESLNAAVAGGIIFYAFSQQCESSSEHGPTLEKP